MVAKIKKLRARHIANGLWSLGCFSLLSLALIFSSPAHAEQKNVRIMMDWIIGSTHTPFLIAQEKGYFKEAGVTVDAIDPGKGATNVAVAVAGGTYQFGWVDMPSMIVFNAKNPASALIAVYVSFEQTPLAVFTRKDANVRKPADLEGKKIAGKPGTAGYDTISILLKAAKAENVKIDWQAVQPQLYAIMTKRGEIDGTAGFLNSNIPAAIEIGIKQEDLAVMKFSDYGADMYGLALVTTKKFADENPNTVRGVVKALNHGTKDSIANPDEALAILKKVDPILKMETERLRLQISNELTAPPFVMKNGLSSVTPDKLKFTIDSVVTAYDIPNRPTPESVFTDKFLPPKAERMPPEVKK
jgi:NitT/TauT family transport system substrate-binding protein